MGGRWPEEWRCLGTLRTCGINGGRFRGGRRRRGRLCTVAQTPARRMGERMQWIAMRRDAMSLLGPGADVRGKPSGLWELIALVIDDLMSYEGGPESKTRQTEVCSQTSIRTTSLARASTTENRKPFSPTSRLWATGSSSIK